MRWPCCLWLFIALSLHVCRRLPMLKCAALGQMSASRAQVGREPLARATWLRHWRIARRDHWIKNLPDVLLQLGAIIALVASCVLISAQKPFWNDEIMAWKVITDPSASHMLWALAHACDGAPPAFHLIARAWVAVFGSSVLSLRLFSCAGMCVALVVMWSTLRRYFQLRAVAFGILMVWCNSTLLLTYNSEARNYGLFLAFAALTVAVADRVANQEASAAKALLVALFGVTTILTFTHYFGLIYSGFVLLVLLVWDIHRKRFRPAVYLAVVAGWLPLLLWVPAILREQALFRERTYYTLPNTLDLLRKYGVYVSASAVYVFLALCALTVALFRRDQQGVRPETRRSSDAESFLPLVLMAAAFLTVPILLFFASRWVQPPYEDRYVLPSAIAFAIFITLLADRLLSQLPELSTLAPPGLRRKRLFSLTWAALFIGLMAGAVQQARYWSILQPVNAELEKVAPVALPMVIEEQHQWMQATFYDRSPDSHYFYVLDRESAMAPHSATDEPFFFNERTAWKRAGYWADHVVQSNDFLCRFERFGVLVTPGRLWFARRIANNPAFVLESDTSVAGGRLFVVSRKPGTPSPCDGSGR